VTEPPDVPYDPNAEADPRWRAKEPPMPPGGWVTLPQAPSQPDPPPYQGPPSYQGPPYQGPPPPYQGPPFGSGPVPDPQSGPPPAWQPQPSSDWQPQPPPGGQWQPPPGGWEQLGPPLPQPRRSRRAPLVAAIGTAAVIAGGTVSYLAVSASHSGFGGAASPQEAVTSLVSDLNKSDLLGILDHLPPGERSALLDPLREAINQEKRLHVLTETADPSRISGVEVTATGITFDKAGDETINDHVKVVRIVGGTVDINSDLSRVPFTQQFLDVVFPNGLPANSTSRETINLAQVNRDNGPLRIAAEKVGDKWYPSLFYTIADTAVHQNGADNPGPSDFIAPKGAPSAVDAVKQAVVALQNSDYQRLIELTSPDEMRVLHDYGGLILRNSSPGSSGQFTIKDLQLTTRKVSGATRVSLKSVTVDTPGHETTVAVSGDCLEITADGDYRKFCAGDIINALNSGPLRSRPLTAEESAALSRFASGIPRIGIDVTSTDGQWYLNPVRSLLDLNNAVLEPLQDNDLLVLLKLLTRQ
jgi:hypothetical protein